VNTLARRGALVVVLLLGLAAPLRAQSATLTISTLPADDRIRLAETFRLAEAVGDSVWPGWSRAPLAVLLVRPDYEYLVRHPRPSPDFVRIGYDSLLGSDVYARPRRFSLGLLATFPAVGGVVTIVVGTPAATQMTSTGWVLTLLHEHFHQWQNSQPGYFQRVLALGLTGGDKTGMWMLNYPFPYDSLPVQRDVADLGRALYASLTSRASDRAARAAEYLVVRHRLRDALSAPDYRYLDFQLWQEGVARYTEYQVARLAATAYTPSFAFTSLPDYTPFAARADELRADILHGVESTSLATQKRIVVYPLGAATALLLDEVAPRWKSLYLEQMFSLDGYFAAP
jgi:hypothetical protein